MTTTQGFPGERVELILRATHPKWVVSFENSSL